MSLTSLVSSQDYRVNIFLRQRWNDPRLKLPQDFKSDSLTVDPKMFKCLWKPDLFFANEKSANFHDVTQENILLFIFRNGDVLISMRYRCLLASMQATLVMTIVSWELCWQILCAPCHWLVRATQNQSGAYISTNSSPKINLASPNCTNS